MLNEDLFFQDYIETDNFVEHPDFNLRFNMKSYKLNEKNSERHRWYYFPNMTKSEVVFFKQYDSDPEQLTNMCFHTAFKDPMAPADYGPRQSMELRLIA